MLLLPLPLYPDSAYVVPDFDLPYLHLHYFLAIGRRCVLLNRGTGCHIPDDAVQVRELGTRNLDRRSHLPYRHLLHIDLMNGEQTRLLRREVVVSRHYLLRGRGELRRAEEMISCVDVWLVGVSHEAVDRIIMSDMYSQCLM